MWWDGFAKILGFEPGIAKTPKSEGFMGDESVEFIEEDKEPEEGRSESELERLVRRYYI